MHGDAGLEQMGGPVGPERVRVRQPLGHPGGLAVAAHEPVDSDGGEGKRVLIAMAADPDEQWLVVEQDVLPDPAHPRQPAQDQRRNREFLSAYGL